MQAPGFSADSIQSAIGREFIDIVTTADGHGFPSGHALGSTMVWGGVALILDQEARWIRLGITGAVVALVALSRLVLGVHYAVDVVVGVALGLVVLGALYRLSDSGTDPDRILLFAVMPGILGCSWRPPSTV